MFSSILYTHVTSCHFITLAHQATTQIRLHCTEDRDLFLIINSLGYGKFKGKLGL